ncbi:MAG TPA: M24 family metallopeptidase [Solirubrobacteraceae bacterium]|nr:M24 family metallopeptidase [Solirubrobacteraceae bacterium]
MSADAEWVVYLHDGVHSYLEPNPVFALTGAKTIGEAAALVGRDGSTTLVAAPAWDAERLREQARCDVVACDDVPMEVAARVAGRVAVAGINDVNSRFRAALWRCALVEIPSDCDRPKTSAELVAARSASAIAEAAYADLLSVLRPGIAEHELIARLDVEVRRRGADDHFVLCSSSPAGDNVRAPTARILAPGDIVNIEISPSVDGQFVQICRTAVLGEAGAQRRQDYALIVTALREAIGAARPGATVAEVVVALDAPLVAAGLGEYCRPPHIRVRGHGQGLASLSPGDITFDNETALEAGMMFTVHPNQRFPKSGYMLCGEPIVVTRQGGAPLTSREPGLDEC